MKLTLKAGATSQTINIFIRDSTSSTGAGLTGLVYNSASLSAYYMLPKAAAVSITLATLAAVTSAYSSGGFKEIDATNAPGWYRFDIPNAAIASGIFSSIHFKGATAMAPLPIEIFLTTSDPQAAGTDPWSTAIPGSYSAGTAGYILGNNLDAAISSRSTYAGLDTSGVTTLLTRLPSAITLTAGKVNVSDKTGFELSAGSVQTIWDSLVSASIVAGSIGKLLGDKIDTVLSTLATVATIFNATASTYNTAGSMGNKINSAASAGDPWSTAIPGAYGAGSAGYILGNNLNATVSSRSTYSGGAVASVTGAVGSVTAGVTVTTNNDKTGYRLSSTGIQDIWDALTSAFSTSGSVGKLLKDDINATISSRSTYAGGDTSGVTTLLSRIGSALTITTGKVDINDKTGFSLGTSGIAGIWNALTSGMSTSSSIGKLLKDDINATISSRVAPADLATLTVTTVSDKTGYTLSAPGVQAIWDALMSALTTSGSVGKLLGDNVNASVSSRLASSAITLSTGAVTVGTNNDKTGYALSAAGIDSILDDTPSAELASIPSFTASLRQMIQFGFQYMKGKKTVTGSTETLFKSDGSSTLGTATLSDNGTTFTKGNLS